LDYKGIIIRHPNDKDKYICLVCQRAKAKKSNGKWYNCIGHIESHTHAISMRKLTQNETQVQPEGEQIEIDDEIYQIRTEEGPKLSDESLYDENLPFSLIKPLVNFVSFLVEQYPPNFLEDFSISRQTITKNAHSLAVHLKENLYGLLRTSPFSLSIDCSFDVYGTSYLAICAKFQDQTNPEHLATKLITTIPITTFSTGEVLYNKILSEVLLDYDIQQNLMGICSDEGPNMMGKDKGCCFRLKNLLPHIVIVKDFSHLFNNILKKALKAFPESVLNIITGISTHFNYSSQRRACLEEIQIENNLPQLTVLNFVLTRWLSMRETVKRILDIWKSLILYFSQHGSKKEKDYCTPSNEVYLRILYILLDQINGYNVYFQEDNIFYNDIIEKIQECFVLFYNMLVPEEEKNLAFEDLYRQPFENLKDKEISRGDYAEFGDKLPHMMKCFDTEYISQYTSIRQLETRRKRGTD